MNDMKGKELTWGKVVEQKSCLNESYIEKDKLTVSTDSIKEQFMSVNSATEFQIDQVE